MFTKTCPDYHKILEKLEEIATQTEIEHDLWTISKLWTLFEKKKKKGILPGKQIVLRTQKTGEILK